MRHDSTDHTGTEHAGTTLAVPRSRGLVTGLLLIALGAWGALLPLLGEYADFGFGRDKTWDFTAARFWLQILPGVVTVIAGIVLIGAGNRVTGSIAAYLAIAAGAWFVVGPILADLRTAGYVGPAIGSSDRQHVEAIAAFYGLGAAIILVGALIAGRLSVVGVRDLRTRDKRHGEDAALTTAGPETRVAAPATREVPVTTTHVRLTDAEPEPVVLDKPGVARDAER